MPRFYGEIAKTEQLNDGSLKVYGYASAETPDSDGETVTAEAMKAAIPDYMRFGAVREMHNPKTAAGTALEIRVEDDGRTWFGAHIVDADAVKKVQAGVYKGFSIGGSVTARDELNKTVITGLKLLEISLVDRPANPEAVLTCYKAASVDDGAADDTAAESETPAEPPSEPDNSEPAAPADNGATDTAETGEPVQKSLYQVKNLADILRDAKYLIDDLGWMQNHPTDVVSDVKAAASLLASGLQKLVAHETAEFGTETEKMEKTETPTDTQKTAAADTLAKAVQSAGFAADTDPADCISKLAQRVKELEQQPEPPKGSLNAVSKTADTGGDDTALKGFTPLTHADGSLNEAATLVKAAQSGLLSQPQS